MGETKEDKDWWKARAAIKLGHNRCVRPALEANDIADIEHHNTLAGERDLEDGLKKQVEKYDNLVRRSKRKPLPAWQEMADDLWQTHAARFGFDSLPPPTLIVGDWLRNKRLAEVMVDMPGYIFINPVLFEPWYGEDIMKATISHEMAHLFNKDCTAENTVARSQAAPNEAIEILADRLGAILSGNPRQYSQSYQKLYEEDLKPIPEESHARRFAFWQRFVNPLRRDIPSMARTLRMMERWADILEEQGAADKVTGEIIDMGKALELYDHSRDFTSTLGKNDSFTSLQEAKARLASASQQK